MKNIKLKYNLNMSVTSKQFYTKSEKGGDFYFFPIFGVTLRRPNLSLPAWEVIPKTRPKTYVKCLYKSRPTATSVHHFFAYFQHFNDSNKTHQQCLPRVQSCSFSLAWLFLRLQIPRVQPNTNQLTETSQSLTIITTPLTTNTLAQTSARLRNRTDKQSRDRTQFSFQMVESKLSTTQLTNMEDIKLRSATMESPNTHMNMDLQSPSSPSPTTTSLHTSLHNPINLHHPTLPNHPTIKDERNDTFQDLTTNIIV
ncbi:uncharacterized protein [Palaemon carinicauda]|uniref:uncharacterized protein n=1 Tax=Palaemon carinicauda TaxID=392227 RepID=UPI0035B68932